MYVTGDDFSIVQLLTNVSLVTLQQRLYGYKTVIIDEAQKIRTIGNTIKLIVDNIPEIQVIATGSSSFDLANHLQEPLTGRAYTFHLHPLSLNEIWKNVPLHQHNDLLQQRIIYGMYPRSVSQNDPQELFDLVQAYVYKDIFLYESLRKPDLIVKLLQALAFQIGSEVSYNELSQLLAVDTKTIQKYVGLLEQAFIVFRLPSLARNMRNEIKRGQKIFFRDTGVRNGLLKNLQSLDTRSDKGALWENFVIAEKMKSVTNYILPYDCFFWRTNDGKEIDYIETNGDMMDAYEIKRSSHKAKSLPSDFAKHYPQASFQTISSDNYHRYIVDVKKEYEKKEDIISLDSYMKKR